jgi:hypothetical protein
MEYFSDKTYQRNRARKFRWWWKYRYIFHITPVPLPPQFNALLQENIQRECDPIEIEINTERQSESEMWYNVRQKRLTACNFL